MSGETLIIDVEVPDVGVQVAATTVDISPSTTAPPVILVPVPGAPGPEGPPGSGVFITGEVPSGAVSGSNTTFTTANVYRPGSTAVYLNGLREHFYAESSPVTLILSSAPESGDDIRVDYVKD
jgi:hypothetical protein